MNDIKIEDSLIVNLSEFYKILSDPTRLKIVCTLIKGELNVQSICEKVNMSQTAVSYQLGILRGARLVKNRRSGKMIFYSIDDDHVEGLINLTIEHLSHED